MTDVWKIKREALRVWHQVSDRITIHFDYARQKRYDHQFPSVTQLISGHAPLTRKIAIFHTFQTGKLDRSIAHTCNFLNRHGYSILLLTVREFNTEELEVFQALCWKILVRPNFGYDFGGYRDGLRVVRDHGFDLDKLIIMNDSMWLPVDEDSTMIEEMENSSLNFLSPVFENKTNRGSRNAHYQSYFYMFNKAAVNSPAFEDYWRNYAVSDDKRLVLLRGEKGLTQALLKADFGRPKISTREKLFNLLCDQDTEFLLTTLKYSSYEDAKMCKQAHALIDQHAATDAWRKDTLLFMQKALVDIQPMGVFPYACMKLLHLSFLKKSGYPIVHYGMRWQFLRAVEAGVLPAAHPDVMAEIKASRKSPRWSIGPE